MVCRPFLLYCFVCAILVGSSAGAVRAFTVSISNYGCVYSGWEESYFIDQDGSWQRWYWSGTATETIPEYSNDWETNRPDLLTCQVAEDSGVTITSSGICWPYVSYLRLNGYGDHVVGSFIDYYQFDFDLAWTGMLPGETWYMCVLSQPVYDVWDVVDSTSYCTKQLSSSGSCHLTGNLNGSGRPIIVLSNIPPAAAVPEPSCLTIFVSGVGALLLRRQRFLK